jgi:predicted SprT family Zn-dependent metalloprotease
MKVKNATLLAKKLLDEHGLEKWKVEICSSNIIFGWCDDSKKTIGLSSKFTELNKRKDVKDTILHEIAHALLPKNNTHDNEWKFVAMLLGCSPESFFDKGIKKPRKKHTYICKKCGRKMKTYGILKNKRICRICCIKYNKGKITNKFELKLIKDEKRK